ncbi:MAG TPA: aminodeoxychorismate lyase [Methylophaga aminisulfidivorans]|uniref:Aminodeoxychorismate lyase n=2 Tax=root TaxID=1 RepID=A0A7C2AAK2_9GAMM|nr:aminodeoxychorismate lyase [Methylophaga aminisulfidivorans]
MILVNGQAESTLPISDRGLQYGDGVFETIVYRQQKLEYLTAHIQRLKLGCKRLNIDFNDDLLLHDELSRVCTTLTDNSIIKVIITRGSGGRGYKAPHPCSPTRIISVHRYPDYPISYKQGITVRFCKHNLAISPTLAGIKHLNRLEQVMARSEWDSSDIQEGLTFDTEQRLIEGTMTNIFLVKSGKLYTPSLTHCGIEGIIRNKVLSLADKLELSPTIGELSQQDLLQADEVFLTNSVIKVWPVVKLVEPDTLWAHGPITQKIQSQLHDVKH